MSIKYILKSWGRRKLRTLIILISLTVGVALVGALLSLVDTQRQFSIQSVGETTGGYDLSITKSDLAASTFFSVTEVQAVANAAYNGIASAHPRIEASVEARKVGNTSGEEVTLIALDTGTDTLVTAEQPQNSATSGINIAGIRIGSSGGGPGGGGGGAPSGGGPGGGGPPSGGQGSNISGGSSSSRATAGMGGMSGSYPPSVGQVYLDSSTAGVLGVQVGDEILISYAVPVQREEGQDAVTGTSTPRIEASFIVAGIGTLDGLSSSTSNPIVMRLDDAQTWLGQSGQANELLLVWESGNASTTDASATTTQARNVGEQVRDVLQAQLGAEYTVSLPKYTSLESSSQSYTFTQIYISLYGLLSMGIIGLMVNALMMTTVAEQKHDLAVLRVIGSPRSGLFQIVVLEVAALGLIGIVLGLVLGRAINDYIMVPIVLANLSLPAGVRAAWTLQTVMTPTLITIAVLTLATISPARAAAATKVMVVLNPAAADQPTLEDLSKLRERRADSGLLIAGLVLLAFSAVILVVLPTIFTGGNMTGQTVLQFGSLLLMVIGISLVFYFLTTPLERVLIFLYRLVFPKAAFFAGRYALRGKGRNALISLMVVMSGVLPCLLATQLALQEANVETESRFNNGAPLIAQARSSSGGFFDIFRRGTRADSNLTNDDVAAVTTQPGIATVIGVADNLSGMTVSDRIAMRTSRASLVGLGGDLNQVLYANLMRWTEGDATSLTRVLSDTNATIISAGLSQSLDLHVGDQILVAGTGTDHTKLLTIIGVASRIPGFSAYFSRNRGDASSSGVFMSLDTYRELLNDPTTSVVDPSAAVLTKLFATVQPGVNQTQLLSALRNYLGNNNDMNVTATSEQVARARTSLEQSRIFIVLLTGLSMVTAIFGVMAVMYTAVMGRRIEIGMMKAIGSSKGALRGAFIGESVITTLAAGVAGIVAGTLAGYATSISQYLQNDLPFLFAFDFSTAGIIIALVCFAAVFSGALATQPVIRQKAIMILRER
jgi:ABC-type antimicrobial peptide transport system permease subunit